MEHEYGYSVFTSLFGIEWNNKKLNVIDCPGADDFIGGVVTALNPIIGYKNSTKIAKEALETGRSVYELVLEHGILNKEELDTILSPENMLKPVKLDIKPRR